MVVIDVVERILEFGGRGIDRHDIVRLRRPQREPFLVAGMIQQIGFQPGELRRLVETDGRRHHGQIHGVASIISFHCR